MKVREVAAVMREEQSVMIIPNIGGAGFYRYMVKNIPPTFLNAEVRNITQGTGEVVLTVVV